MSCIKGGICEHGGCSNCMGEPNVKLQEDWKDQAMSADDVKNSKRIWIYRMYSDVKGMGEYTSWKPEGLGDAKEYLPVEDHDRVVAELKAEIERLTQTTKAKADKIQALVSQMSRHENLNKEDMPFVCEILNGELESIMNQLKAGGEK